MANDSVARTFLVAFLVCFVCSLLVSATAAGLRAKQERDARLSQYREVLAIADLMTRGADVAELWEQKVVPRMVKLADGSYTDAVEVEEFDQYQAASDSELGRSIPPDKDLADIKRRARYAPVYLIRDGDRFSQVVLPVHGKGLWSTLYGYLALESDLRTISGFGFYEHGETPGLGGEVDNPQWLAKWEGKKVADEQGIPRIEVIKGSVDSDSPRARYQVDGLSGATATSRGVTNLLRYWLGEDGFGPYLERMRAEGLHD
jgi:Na+-transporting NADH:ubiquinone oxidoreductase subunit C